jgi:hypothetical protein
MPRYQVLDPNFQSGNLGGNLITVIDGIATVTMTAQQASYWLTQGAVIPLGQAGQINYQMMAPWLVVGSPIIDVPIESVNLFGLDLDCGSPTIDMAAAIDMLAASVLTTTLPAFGAPMLA